jgi:hypothetical protein
MADRGRSHACPGIFHRKLPPSASFRPLITSQNALFPRHPTPYQRKIAPFTPAALSSEQTSPVAAFGPCD